MFAKKIFALISTVMVLCVLLGGCAPENYDAHMSNGDGIHIVTFDGCEYFTNSASGNLGPYTHKGNCKNPIHRYNKVTTTIKVDEDQ